MGVGWVEGVQTWRDVVAHSKDGSDISADIAEALWTVALSSAVISGAANLGGALPHDLGEVTPAVKGAFIVDVGGSGLAVETSKVARLVVVEKLGDDGGDIVSRASGGDVLAVSALAIRVVDLTVRESTSVRLEDAANDLRVVLVDAGLSNLHGSSSDAVVPSQGWSRVVGTMGVVVVSNRLRIAGASARSRD